MSIWNGEITTIVLNDLNKNTLGEFFEIDFIEVGPDYLKAKMPVTNKVKQPFGLLHGGASVALAETIGSVASWCLVNRELFMGVGVEINASHVKAVTSGSVTAICSPIKIGGKTHIWEIKIYNDQNELCCVSRFTAMVVPKTK
ncbi:MAG: esterase [Bacteroidetes bacterium]|jgi:1,4-dihydroxy-2-naphthoyl-CoA hydrolase|nr:esterase [Bacteroidota bacterium]